MFTGQGFIISTRRGVGYNNSSAFLPPDHYLDGYRNQTYSSSVELAGLNHGLNDGLIQGFDKVL